MVPNGVPLAFMENTLAFLVLHLSAGALGTNRKYQYVCNRLVDGASLIDPHLLADAAAALASQ